MERWGGGGGSVDDGRHEGHNTQEHAWKHTPGFTPQSIGPQHANMDESKDLGHGVAYIRLMVHLVPAHFITMYFIIVMSNCRDGSGHVVIQGSGGLSRKEKMEL